MQVVYQEMTRGGAKSNVAKWNLIGGIQFKHVKNCLMQWTLDIVFIVHDGMLVVWHVRCEKRSGKNIF